MIMMSDSEPPAGPREPTSGPNPKPGAERRPDGDIRQPPAPESRRRAAAAARPQASRSRRRPGPVPGPGGRAAASRVRVRVSPHTTDSCAEDDVRQPPASRRQAPADRVGRVVEAPESRGAEWRGAHKYTESPKLGINL